MFTDACERKLRSSTCVRVAYHVKFRVGRRSVLYAATDARGPLNFLLVWMSHRKGIMYELIRRGTLWLRGAQVGGSKGRVL